MTEKKVLNTEGFAEFLKRLKNNKTERGFLDQVEFLGQHEEIHGDPLTLLNDIDSAFDRIGDPSGGADLPLATIREHVQRCAKLPTEDKAYGAGGYGTFDESDEPEDPERRRLPFRGRRRTL